MPTKERGHEKILTRKQRNALSAILTAVALTLGSVDVTALASAAGQNAAEQTAVEPKNTEGRAAMSGETEGQANRRTMESSRA